MAVVVSLVMVRTRPLMAVSPLAILVCQSRGEASVPTPLRAPPTPTRGVRRKDEASNSSVGLFYHTLNRCGMDVFSLTRRTRYPCSIFFQEILPTRVKTHLARFHVLKSVAKKPSGLYFTAKLTITLLDLVAIACRGALTKYPVTLSSTILIYRSSRGAEMCAMR
jgi:hypothetical protein